jgi:hypothetical protein
MLRWELKRFSKRKRIMDPQQTTYAVGWGTLALINAGLAQSKNRSGFAWFLLSLILGPVATFLIVILDRLPGRTE